MLRQERAHLRPGGVGRHGRGTSLSQMSTGSCPNSLRWNTKCPRHATDDLPDGMVSSMLPTICPKSPLQTSTWASPVIQGCQAKKAVEVLHQQEGLLGTRSKWTGNSLLLSRTAGHRCFSQTLIKAKPRSADRYRGLRITWSEGFK